MINVLKYCLNEKKIPIIFSSDIIHCDVMADAVSAGFLVVKFDIDTLKFKATCFGESLSLKIKIANDDEEIIENYLNNKFHSSELTTATPQVYSSEIK